MNDAYLHLLINHIPVILAPLGALAAILALVKRNRTVWLYAVATLTLAGAAVYPVKFTGERAEKVVERAIPTVSKDAIHDHEEAGDTATWILLATGAISAWAWWRLARGGTTLPTWLAAAVVIGALASAGAVSYASYEGGLIVHTEAHNPVPPAAPGQDVSQVPANHSYP